MKKNVGQLDKVIRFVLGILLVVVAILVINSILWLSIVLFVFALMMFVTALLERCSLYVPFKISTRAKEEKPKA